MVLSVGQTELLRDMKSSLEKGLSREEASKRREDDESFNVVDPPLKCPAWVCCLLPCIKSIPSMKKFREVQPEDAEVLRDSKWMRYDATGLVRGDIIKIYEGDIVPADIVLLQLLDEELLIDNRTVTGEDKPKSVDREADGTCVPIKFYYGGLVLAGSAIAIVTQIGPNTLLANLIKSGLFPPKENVIANNPMNSIEDGDTEVGISLLSKDAMA